MDFAAHILSSKPKLDITAHIKTTLIIDLEKNIYQVQGLDLQANGAALDITNLVVKASGDAGVQPSVQEFSLNKFAFTVKRGEGKDHLKPGWMRPA